MLHSEQLQVCYGDAVAIDDITLDVPAGTVTAILGANGAGKSTLLRTVAGLLKPSAGSITFEGERIDSLPSYAVTERGIALVPEGRRVFATLSVQENLEMGGYSRHARKLRGARIREVYDLFPALAERRRQDAGTLSGGEQQMLAIGRALMAQPRLILLDEPSLGLAPKVTRAVYETIRSVSQLGITMLLVEQNASLGLSTASRGYVLEQGRMVFAGDRNQLKNAKVVRDAYLGI